MKHITTQMLLIMLMSILCLSTVSFAEAGEIRGQITVFQRGKEKPLRSFANALVYLTGVETAVPEEPAVLNQIKKAFVPRVLPVIKGQEVQFLNSDRVRHNVFSPHEEESFDLGHYPRGEFESMTFQVLGQHKVYCNIHQNMVADIVVLPNHYFAITDDDGNFSIPDVPAGDYSLRVWHILGGETEQAIQVADAPVEVALTVQSQKFTRQTTTHRNKFGQSYDEESESGGY